MGEDDFTKLILKPLFEAMGYERVDFNGGPYERGRDLIAQIRMPPRKEPRVVYIQSKKIGDIQNTKSSAKLSQLLHQLRQCCTQKVTTIEGKELAVDDVYLACPEQISNRLLEEISGQLLGGLGKEIIPYDGPRILEDIKAYMPSLLENLGDIDDEMLAFGNKDLVNEELLSALKSKNDISIENFYHDLSFFVGSVDSNLLLYLEPEIRNCNVTNSEEEWIKTKKHTHNVLNKHGLNIFNKSICEIEEDYKKRLELYVSQSNKDNIRELESLESKRESISEGVASEIKSLKILLENGLNSSTGPSSLRRKSLITNGVDEEVIRDRIAIANRLLTDLEVRGGDVGQIAGDIPKDEAFFPKISPILKSMSKVSVIKNRVEKIRGNIFPNPMYEMELNDVEIISRVNDGSSKYRKTIISINNGNSSNANLNRFLTETEKTLSLVAILMDENFTVSNSIVFKIKGAKSDRVSISPHDIFSTGQDIAVYGGAGVGKTTTLQAYAVFCSDTENKVIIYVPLNRVVEKYRDEVNAKGVDYNKNLVQKLILISKNQRPTDENIDKLNILFLKPVALILDGLDEVYNSMPSIIKDIADFKNKFPLVQLIISSRDCVSYLSEISFLGITLLPFTRQQLSGFIRGWIDGEDKANSLINSISKRDLYDHIKTPLLATIACSLVERGIDALSSEFEIYSERLSLLTGEYDAHKKINRQNQKGSILRFCAEKIALSMHQSNVRSISKDRVFSRLRASLSSDYSDDLLNECISELEDPCNILIKDRLTNKYSFGHFRFQEHLAASELSGNRNIDITELTRIDWWRGALSIYAQKNDIHHLFEDIYNKYNNIQGSKISLKAMIMNSPKNKQKGLLELLKRFNEADDFDRSVVGMDNYDYY